MYSDVCLQNDFQIMNTGNPVHFIQDTLKSDLGFNLFKFSIKAFVTRVLG